MSEREKQVRHEVLMLNGKALMDEFQRQAARRTDAPIVVSSKAYHRWYCDCHSRDPQPAVPLEAE